MVVPNPKGISRSSLHHELLGCLQILIIKAKLERGAKVLEKLLSSQLGVFCAPLREAIKVLARWRGFRECLAAFFETRDEKS